MRSFLPEERGRQLPTTSWPRGLRPACRSSARGPCARPRRAAPARGRGPGGTGRTARAAAPPLAGSAPVSASTSSASTSRRWPSTSTGTTSSGHRAAISFTGESTYPATSLGVDGPRNRSTPRTGSRRAGTCSARPRQPRMRWRTGGEVPGSSSRPAWQCGQPERLLVGVGGLARPGTSADRASGSRSVELCATSRPSPWAGGRCRASRRRSRRARRRPGSRRPSAAWTRRRCAWPRRPR